MNERQSSQFRAFAAAGIELPNHNSKWDGERIVKAIQWRYAKGGSLQQKEVRKSERELYPAAQRHFGSWTVFLIATGVLIFTSVHDGSIRL